MSFKTLKDFDLKGKTVFLRADLNVPAEAGRVTDTTRIDRLKPTIEHLRSQGAKIIIGAHYGRPKGEIKPEFSLRFILDELARCWNVDVGFAEDSIGEIANDAVASLNNGDVLLLENLRFYKGEEENDPSFAKDLADLADVFVNDSFSASHRAHASIEGITHHLPSAAGLLMEEELEALNKALGSPKRPVSAITGGSKVSTKLSVLKNLSAKVDYLVLGGGMANTFLYAQGIDIGTSLCEKDMAAEARDILNHAKTNGCEIILPIDVVTVKELAPGAKGTLYSIDNIPSDEMAVDAGEKTIEYALSKIKTCKTLVWNGPMGVFEIKPFDHATNLLACGVAELTQNGNLISMAGGGDTVAALDNAGVIKQFSYISTAGGAFLEWLEGKELPGVAALYNQSKAET